MLSNRSPNLFPHPDHPHYLCYFIYRCSLRAKLLTPSKMSIRYSSKQSFSQGTLPLGIEDTTSNMPASALYNPHNLRHSTNLQSCKRNRGMAHCFTNFDYNEVHLRKPQNFRATEVHKRPRWMAKHICYSQSAPKILFCAGWMWYHYIFLIAQPKPKDQMCPLTQIKLINPLNAEWSPYIKVNTKLILQEIKNTSPSIL